MAQWLLPVVGVLFLAALVLARRRRRMAVWVGAVVAANALLLAWVLSIGRQMFVNALAGTEFGPASRVFFDTLLTYLDRGQQVVLWLGLVIVLAGLFAGSNRYGTTARTTIGGGLENLGARLADGPVGGAGRWVATNVTWVRVAVVALGGVVLLWGNNVSMDRLWWSLALVVGLLVVLHVLVGAGRPREPTASLGSGSAT